MRSVVLLILSAGLASCGSETSEPGDHWELDQPNAARDVEAGEVACAADADCAEDEYCHRPSTCGSERFCQEGYPPISAAPPNLACGCGGTLTWVGHGYPGPHAWLVGNLAYSEEPSPCDADAQPPFSYSIELQLSVPDAAEARVLTQLAGGLETDDAVRELPADGVLTYEATGDQWVSFQVRVLVDFDGDGECGGSDRSYHATLSEPDVDLQTFEVRGAPGLSGSAEDPCVFWLTEAP